MFVLNPDERRLAGHSPEAYAAQRYSPDDEYLYSVDLADTAGAVVGLPEM